MEQMNITKESRGGKHFTWEQRVKMETLFKVIWPHGKKINFAGLSRLMDKSRKTVRVEYYRGQVVNADSELRKFNTYSAEKGRQIACEKGSNKGRRGKLTNLAATRMENLIIAEHLSPYVARIRMIKEGWEGLPCVRSIYYSINAGDLEIIRKSLPYKKNGKKKAKKEPRMAYTNKTGKSITERPPEAEDRKEYGHWEIDTVVGGVGASSFCLLVLTERMSRRQIIIRIRDRTQKSVKRALNKLERRDDNIFISMKSLTSDNGCEFLDSNAIEQSVLNPKRKRVNLYYAHPYSSFERGSNENANRLIRRFIPKGADIGKYTIVKIQKIEDWMNQLPRKLFNDKTALEVEQEIFNRMAI